jgi:hypothetical protein
MLSEIFIPDLGPQIWIFSRSLDPGFRNRNTTYDYESLFPCQPLFLANACLLLAGSVS